MIALVLESYKYLEEQSAKSGLREVLRCISRIEAYLISAGRKPSVQGTFILERERMASLL